jgi:uncharacterized membrane protein YoaK (UPF0700 family)
LLDFGDQKGRALGKLDGEMAMLKHLGSTIAIILGLIVIAAIASQPQSSLPIAGAVTLLGALVAAVLVILLQTDLKRRLTLDPVPTILPILWALAAYAIALFRKYPAALAKG